MSMLPDLPSIDGDLDLMLDVFTHKTAKNDPGIKEGTVHGDTDRLAELGAKILDVTVTYHLFSQRPYQSAEELKVCSVIYASCYQLTLGRATKSSC